MPLLKGAKSINDERFRWVGLGIYTTSLLLRCGVQLRRVRDIVSRKIELNSSSTSRPL